MKKVFAGIFALAAALALISCANNNSSEVTLIVVNEWDSPITEIVVNEWADPITEVGLSGSAQFRWEDLSIAESQTFRFDPGTEMLHANVFVYAPGLRDGRREVGAQFARGNVVTVTLHANGVSMSSTWQN